MRKKVCTLLLSVLLIASSSRVTQAAVYNATADFSITNGNPNGVWSYGYMPSDFSVFHAHTTTVDGIFIAWYTPGLSGDSTPIVAINNYSSTLYGVNPGQMTLHPGPSGEVATLRFTAPATGEYDIAGQFFPGDSGTMSVGVRQGSTWLMTGTDSGSFSLPNQALTAGSTVDFVVYGGYYSGNTPLELTITSVPEPSAILLMGAGLASLAIVRKRKA